MRYIAAIAFFLILFIAAPQAGAQQSAWVGADHIKARLISEYKGVGRLKSFTAGLEIELEEDWYTYWRNPGDAGLAPQMDWSGSENLGSIDVSWPIPSRFDTFGLNSFGYKPRTVFPLTIKPEKRGEAVTLSLNLKTVVCKDICVPQTLGVELTIDAGDALRTEHSYPLEQAVKALPSKDNSDTLKVETAVIGKDALVITAYAKDGFDAADVFIESKDNLLTLPPDIMIDDKDIRRAIFKVPTPGGIDDLIEELDGQKVTVTLVNRGRAVEQEFNF